MKNLLIIGNGFDKALGFQTGIEILLNEIKNENLFGNKKDINNIYLSNAEKIDLFKFIYIFDYSIQNEENNQKINWSNFEESVFLIFENISNLKNETLTLDQKKVKNNQSSLNFAITKVGDWKFMSISFKTLKKGYKNFVRVMNFYYLNKIDLDIDARKKEGQLKKQKAERFIKFIQKNNTEIISLNYTNTIGAIIEKFQLNNSDEINFYYLHLIINGLTFIDSIKSNKSISLGSIKSEIGLIDVSSNLLKFKSKIHNKIQIADSEALNKPIFIYKREKEKIICKILTEINDKETTSKSLIICLLKKLKEQYIPTSYSLPDKELNILILGYENEKEKLLFLSKNKNPELFINNYPKQILSNLSSKKVIFNSIFVFGYSFGNSDSSLNTWLSNHLVNKDNICLVFFKEDKNNERIIDVCKTSVNTFILINKLSLSLRIIFI